MLQKHICQEKNAIETHFDGAPTAALSSLMCSAYVPHMPNDHSTVKRVIATVRIGSGTRLGKIEGVRLGPDGEKIYSVRTRSRPRQAWSKMVHEVPVSAFLGGDPNWEV